MGRRYVRLFFEELAASESWKRLDPKARAHALYDLVQGIVDGGAVPPMWRRVAELRTIGEQGKAKKPSSKENKYSPFRRHWEESWLEAKQEAWSWDGKQKGVLRLCWERAEGSLEAFQRRSTAMFNHKNAWIVENASLSLLLARWNELAGGPSKPIKGQSAYACGRCGGVHVSVRCPA